MRYWGALLAGIVVVSAAAAPARGDTVEFALPSLAGPRTVQVERYAAPRIGYYSVKKPIGGVQVNQVLIGRRGRSIDGEPLWRIGMSVRNLTRLCQGPIITLVLFQGDRVIRTLALYDGGYPLPPARSAWNAFLVPLPRGMAPDGFAVVAGSL